MKVKNNFIFLSVALLLFNLVLGGFAVFNFLQGNPEISRKLSFSKQKEEVLGASNLPTFDPNFIMSNQTFSSTRSFPNEDSVQKYLDSTGSPLRSFNVEGKRASYWIFGASRGQTSSRFGVVPNINPGVILAYLEKEQSLISLKNYDVYKDPSNRIKNAMGYGCPDTAACDEKYKGFVNQVNWGAYQLQFNYNNSSSGRNVLPYKTQNTIATLDEFNVFLTNEATAAQYRYTPHVCFGNINLWGIIVANGWGVETKTYNFQELISNNIKICTPSKIEKLPTDENRINFKDVETIVRKNFTFGVNNNDIRTLQRFLRQEGYYMNREINGMYGLITDKALKSYRADKGVIGEFKSIPKSRCLELIDRKWKIGEKSNDVRDLQQCLRDLGLFEWPTITGLYGQITEKGINNARKALKQPIKFQKQEEPTPNNINVSCDNLKSQTFKFGESGNRVKQLQECMKQAGLFSWKNGSTGFFGPVTQSSYNSWKGKTSNDINYSCDNLKQQTWATGETSGRVKQLQICMQKAGKFNWKNGATGFFGTTTRQSLINWRGYF